MCKKKGIRYFKSDFPEQLANGSYEVLLWNIDTKKFDPHKVDNNKWYSNEPQWNGYTAAGVHLTVVDSYTFIPCGNLLRQYKDTPIMESRVLKTAILKNPCILEGPMLHFADYQIESEWMQEFNKVFGLAINIAFIPAAVDVLFPIIVEKMGEEAGRRFVTGAVLEATMYYSVYDIIGEPIPWNDFILDVTLGGLKSSLNLTGDIGAWTACLQGIDVNVLSNMLDAKDGSGVWSELPTVLIQCTIPYVFDKFLGNTSSDLYRATQRTSTLSLVKFFNKCKISQSIQSELLSKCNKFEALGGNHGAHWIENMKRLITTENGAKAYDLLLSTKFDINKLSFKNFQRLSNVLSKFDYATSERLAGLFRVC